MTLDEDQSRSRTVRVMTVLGMFRRLAVSFACVWLDHPARRNSKFNTLDFLNADSARRAFSRTTSVKPTDVESGIDGRDSAASRLTLLKAPCQKFRSF